MRRLLESLLPVGSRSLLYGVHQFAWHPYTVYRAWTHLYGQRPSWKEAVCIIVHDWGYWRKPNMDGDSGELHPEVGAKIAGFLFGPEYRDLVLYHSRSYAKRFGAEPSRLCRADKLSILYDPKRFYLLRAKMTGEIAEYRLNAAEEFGLDRTDGEWFDWLKAEFERSSGKPEASRVAAEEREAIA